MTVLKAVTRFSEAAEYYKRGENTHAMEFRIGIHPLDIRFSDFIGLAVDDEYSSGRDLLDGVVKGGTDGWKFMDAAIGVEGECGGG